MILVHSKSGDLAALARSWCRRGRPASLYVDDAYCRRQGLFRGLVPQHASLESALSWGPEAVIFDMTGSGARADRLRRYLPVWGAGAIQDRMEMDRGYGFQVMVANGIRIPDTYVFGQDTPEKGQLGGGEGLYGLPGHLEEAARFVERDRRRYVFKPFETTNSHLTYVSESWEDMAQRLREVCERDEVGQDQAFALQQFVEGVEVSTEVWVVNGKVVPGSMNATIETKKFARDELGPNTGCQTSVCWGYRGIPRLAEESLLRGPLIDWLEEVGYHGPLDLNCIVSDEDGVPYGLEWTPRHGYSAIWALAELMGQDTWDVWRYAALGSLASVDLREGFAYAVRASVPPYPVSESTDSLKQGEIFDWVKGPLVRGGADLKKVDDVLDRSLTEWLLSMCDGSEVSGQVDSEHVWLSDVRGEGDRLVVAGTSGIVGDCTGYGTSIEAARDAGNAVFEELKVADKYGRLDADRAILDYARLRRVGLV